MQESVLVPESDLLIHEYHPFCCNGQKGKENIISGIILKQRSVKGVLVNDYSKYSCVLPLAIKKKLAKMIASCCSS